MSQIKTANFELAVYVKGNESAAKLAIVCPGLLDPKNYPHMTSHVDFLADQGFLALSFDPPGTWESDGTIDDYTMTNYLKAIDELIAYYSHKPSLVLGHSLGGTISMLAAIKNPHVKAFGAIMSPPMLTMAHAIDEKAVEWKKEGTRIAYRAVVQNQPEKKRFELPYAFLQDARKHNALEGLSTLAKPKLFISGDTDTSVDPKLVEEAFSVSAGPKELYRMQSDHNYRYHDELITKANDEIASFIEKYKL